MQWADQWVRSDGGRVALSHAECGSPIQVEVRCARGHIASTETIEATLRP